MNCANCGAPLRPNVDTGMVVCAYCDTARLPVPEVDGVRIGATSDLKCPGCKSLLSEGRMESQDLLYCQTCRGMLIPMGAFMGLVERLRVQRDRPIAALPRTPADSGLPRLCAYCTEPMDNHPYMGPGNIVVDSCSACQVLWLDKGELTRVVLAPDYAPPPSLYSSHDAPRERGERERSLLERILDL